MTNWENLVELMKRLMGKEKMIQGSLYRLRKRCGIPTCSICASKKYHLVWQFSYKTKDKQSTSTTITEKEHPVINKLWINYKSFIKDNKKARILFKKIQKELVGIKRSRFIDIRYVKKELHKGENF